MINNLLAFISCYLHCWSLTYHQLTTSLGYFGLAALINNDENNRRFHTG